MISYVLPTRDRPQRLAQTLKALGRLGSHDRVGGAEVIVVDNASSARPRVPRTLDNGLQVSLIELPSNEGAAARNVGVLMADPASNWIVMLDDDSHPMDTGLLTSITRAPLNVAAITADIHLPNRHRREAGGLPEVPVGCGVAYRREVYERLGGYNASFDYYVEEYDLAARILLAGYHVRHDPWFRVAHHKVDSGRDFDRILSRLVRNNGWVAQRYTPAERRREALREVRHRYRAIAGRESAIPGYARGLLELRRTVRAQPRHPMPAALHDRFTGLAHARHALATAHRRAPLGRVALVAEGKNAWVVRRALAELGVPTDAAPARADTLVIATMSPGPMADAWERLRAEACIPRVVAPWLALGHPRHADASNALTGCVGRSAAPHDTRMTA